MDLDKTADIIIIGGGVFGCSIAWNLSKRFEGSIVILENNSVAFGASSRAAGLLTLAKKDPFKMGLVRETYRAIKDLEEQLGYSLGEHNIGSLYLASSETGRSEMNKIMSTSADNGLKIDWISPVDAEERVPFLELPKDKEFLIASMSEDSIIDPYMLTNAYASAARMLGVKIKNGVTVQRICVENNRVVGVETDQGNISAPHIINAAGVWSGKMMMELGIGLPFAPVRSQYWITESSTKVTADQPFLILPDAKAYVRPEMGGLLFGLREIEAYVANPKTLPSNMDDHGIPEDPKGMESLLAEVSELMELIPDLETLGIAHYIRGFSSYTLDGNFILGDVSGIDGLILATGCSGGGIAASGGIGKVISQHILESEDTPDLSSFRYDRLGQLDHFSKDLQRRCGIARSRKKTG